ncbi:MAG: AraC family transcriptional regulator [Paenibacillaceae bacterium]|jgi:AraC-like DNA-binding protein|nr:AraC family transcriptional regulator [Paenibacillaceae bacterium]
MLNIGELASKLNQLVITILLIGHQKTTSEWFKPLVVMKYHSFWLIVKGKGTFTVNGTPYPAEPGKIFFHSPGMQIERTTDPDSPLEYYFLRFHYTETYWEKEQWISRSARECPFPIEGPYTIHNAPQLIQILEQINQLWQRRGHMTAMRRNILLHEFLLGLLQDFRAQQIAGDTTVAIEHTQDYMTRNYREQLTLENLAYMAGLSVSHYSRLFKKSIGYSPIEYLTHLRIDRAKEMLALSDYRLKAIAQSVGYADEFYFSRIFKKIEGISPRDYAKRNSLAPVIKSDS